MNEQLLNKLTKLLNLSKSSNVNEAELALQKATAMATEAGIDLAVVAARGVTEAERLEMVQEELKSGARLASTQKYASWLLMKHFGVQVVYSGNRYMGRTISILGDKRDVEFAKYVNEFVQDDMQRRWEYYKQTNKVALRFKQTFMYNLYLGLSSKLEEAKKQAEETKFAAMQQSEVAPVRAQYSLVLTNKAQKVNAYMKQQYPHLRSTRVSVNTIGGSSVASDGYAVGRTMSINRPLSC